MMSVIVTKKLRCVPKYNTYNFFACMLCLPHKLATKFNGDLALMGPLSRESANTGDPVSIRSNNKYRCAMPKESVECPLGNSTKSYFSLALALCISTT
jgi:hypothetical protein